MEVEEVGGVDPELDEEVLLLAVDMLSQRGFVLLLVRPQVS